MHTLLTTLRQFVSLKWGIPAVLIMASLGLVPAAQAQITLTFVYDSGTSATTATYSGSWGDWSDFGPATPSSAYLFDHTGSGFQALSGGTVQFGNFGVGITDTLPWTAASGTADSHSGDDFGFTGSALFAPSGYTIGTAINGSMTWNKTLTTLGLTDGASGVLGSGSNTVAWSVSTAAAVPEPSTYALFAGLGMLGFVAWRRCSARS